MSSTVPQKMLTVFGVVFLAVAVLSIPIPGFPSSFFLLASMVLFAKSSPRLELWARNHRWLGSWIEKVEQRRKLAFVEKLGVVVAFWGGLSLSWWLLQGSAGAALEIGLLGTGLLVLVVVLRFG